MAHLVPTVHPAALLRGGKPISDIIVADLAKANRISMEGFRQEESFVICLPSNPSGMERAVREAICWMDRWIGLRCPVAVDVETSSLDFFNCKLYSVALSGECGRNTAVAFTLRDMRTLPWDAELSLCQKLGEVLAHPHVSTVYHNAPYDYAVLTRKGFHIDGPIEDTQAYAHIVQPDVPKDLGWVGHTYLDVEPWKLNHKGEKMAFARDVVELLVYNAKDALNTMKLRQPLLAEIMNRGMNMELASYQNAFARLAAHMEIVGLPVNMEKRAKMGAELLVELDKMRHDMRQWLNWPEFNPMNKNHAVEALYNEKYVGLTPTVFTPKKGLPSTKYEDIIDYMEHPFVKQFIKYVENHHVYATQYRDPPPAGKKGPRAGAYYRAMMDDGRLHCKWNPTGQKGSRFSSEPNCFDAETDVLTTIGWLPFPDATARAKQGEGLRFAQYNPDSEKITFAVPLEVYVQTRDKLLHLKGQQVDVCATPNHRMLLREYNPNKHERQWEVCELQELPAHKRFVHAGQYAFGKTSVGGVDFMRLLVACQADGSWHKGGMVFDFKHRRKYERLTELLGKNNIKDFSVKERPDADKHRFRVRVLKSHLTKMVEGWIGPERQWGPWLLSLPRAEAEAFVDEVGHWDGRIEANRRFYYSLTETNTNWVQIMAILCGHRATSLWAGTCFRVSISHKKAFSSARVLPQVLENKQQKVYCISVPRGFIVVRRNGKALVVGNCQNQRVKDRAWLEAGPGRVIIGADKDQLELRLAAVLSGVEELVTEMNKPDGDPHTLAAVNVYGEPFLKKDKAERKRLRDAVKTTVYASLYRAGVKTVHKSIRKKKFLDPALRAAMTVEVVGHIYHSYFGKYVEIPAWHDKNYELAQTQGFLEILPLGRRRYFPVQPPPYTEVANWPIQSLGSDVVGMQMVQIQDELNRNRGRWPDAHIILHGHDAVYIECYERHAKEIIEKVVAPIFGHFPVEGPAGMVDLTAVARIGKNLKEAK